MTGNKRKTLIACVLGASALLFAASPVQAKDYTVKAGDTFWKLAVSMNIPLHELLAANPHADPLNLRIGHTIVIPDGTAATTATAVTASAPSSAGTASPTYTVQGDETFWDISRKLGIPLEKLMAANAHLDPLNLYDGLTLQLPTAKTAAVSVLSASSPASSASTDGGRQIRTVDGRVLTYKKALQVKASAYSASAEENGKWGAVDYFGNALKLGTIAVDPSVIPFGSKVYVTGYDHQGLPVGGMFGTASDTGSSIKGNRIDIFIPGGRNNALTFGLQDVTLYILDES
jgi:3D (Asp-Asp-Asp) domain-containing protein